jgi:chaperonin GroEL
MENQILFGKDGRDKVKEGIDKTANAVRVTLGARGKNSMHIRQSGKAIITGDGVATVQSIFLEDPIERAGSDLVKEVAFKTLIDIGDNTTTASILFQEIVSHASGFLDEGNVNVNELNRGIKDAIKYSITHIKHKAQPISGNLDLLKKIAIVSTRGDIDLGTVIAQAVNAAGENGKVSVVESATKETGFSMVEGMRYERGFLAQQFITNKKKNLCVLENPYILISERPLMQLKPLIPIMEKVITENFRTKLHRPLLVIAPEVDLEALAALVGNHVKGMTWIANGAIEEDYKGGLLCCAVQCPGQGRSMEAFTTDLAIYTGATVISEERNIKLESATLSHLGGALRVEVEPNSTLIVGGHGDDIQIQERIESIKSLLDATSDLNEKETLSSRISSISCGVAILSIGAGSVTEGREKADRVDDAIKACNAANEEGYVAGSGATLNGACFQIPLKKEQISGLVTGKNNSKGISDYHKGLFCVHQALQAISAQIVKNAGKPSHGGPFPAEMYHNSYGRGYDAKADEICDLIERGVIDPAKGLRVALQNAASVATTFLTTEVFSFVK